MLLEVLTLNFFFFFALLMTVWALISLQPLHTGDYVRQVLTFTCNRFDKNMTKTTAWKSSRGTTWSYPKMNKPHGPTANWQAANTPKQNKQTNPPHPEKPKNWHSCLNANNALWGGVSDIKGMLNYPTHFTNISALTFWRTFLLFLTIPATSWQANYVM